MNIIEEFKARIEADQVLGTYQWLLNTDWGQKDKLRKFILDNIKKFESTFTRRQKTITYLSYHHFGSRLKLKEVKVELDGLDEEEVQELMLFYHLTKPMERYKEIRRDINGPQSFMTRIPYSVIHELYKRKKIPFDRQIFVGCLVRFNVWHGTRYKKEISQDAKDRLTEVFPTDDFSLDILMGVFEMELGVNNAFYLESDYNIGGLIIALTDLKILNRESIHLKIFEAFNNPNLKQTTHAWVKNIHEDLEFTTEELLPHQDRFINLLQNDRNLLAIYGLKVLKKLSQAANFNWKLFVSNLEGIVYREKFNSGFNIALGMIQKRLKIDQSLSKQICINLAPIFLQPDHKVQLKAKTIFEIMPPEEEIINALSSYVETMHSEVKRDLANFTTGFFSEENTIEVYQQEAYNHPPLNDVDKLKYINKEEDFIFLTSKVLKSQDSLDLELFLESLPRFYYLKDNKSLKPTLKQAKRMLPGLYAKITNKVGAHHLMLARLICIWLEPATTSFEEETKNWEQELKKKKPYVYSATQWLTYFKMLSRITYLASSAGSSSSNLPLLSISTHTNGQIHPDAFLERLKQYEASNVIPHEGDFNTALCRINRWTPFKNKTISNRENDEFRHIIDYLLEDKQALDPAKVKKLERIWLTAFSIKNPEIAIDATLAYQQNKPWWQPDKGWVWKAGRRYSEHYSWATTSFSLEAVEQGLRKNCYFGFNLVFHYTRIADITHWFYRDLFQTETLYLNLCDKNFSYLNIEADQSKSVLAAIGYAVQHLNPIAKAGHVFLVLSLFCQDRSLRSGALDWLCQLIEHKILDLEQFIDAVKKLVVNPDHPIPTARISEQLSELITLRGTYENVAFQMLKEIILEIDIKKLPKGFSKILNHFYEVYQNSNEKLSEKLKLQLEAMTQIKTVKKEANKILGL